MTTAQQLALVLSAFDDAGIPSGDLRDRVIFFRGVCAAIGLRSRRTPTVPLPLPEAEQDGEAGGAAEVATPPEALVARPATASELATFDGLRDGEVVPTPDDQPTPTPEDFDVDAVGLVPPGPTLQEQADEDQAQFEATRTDLDDAPAGPVADPTVPFPVSSGPYVPPDAKALRVLAKQKAAEEKEVEAAQRRELWHESWHDERTRKGFFAALANKTPPIKGKDADALSAFCESKGRPRVSAQTPTKRNALLGMLDDPEFRAEFNEFCGRVEGDPELETA